MRTLNLKFFLDLVIVKPGRLRHYIEDYNRIIIGLFCRIIIGLDVNFIKS